MAEEFNTDLVIKVIEENKRLEADIRNWEARYDALLKTNEYLRYKGESVTYHGFTKEELQVQIHQTHPCLLYTSPSPRDGLLSRMPSSA